MSHSGSTIVNDALITSSLVAVLYCNSPAARLFAGLFAILAALNAYGSRRIRRNPELLAAQGARAVQQVYPNWASIAITGLDVGLALAAGLYLAAVAFAWSEIEQQLLRRRYGAQAGKANDKPLAGVR